MGLDEYFGLIIMILTALTFVALSLIFLYMIYGEKRETVLVKRTRRLKVVEHQLFRISSNLNLTCC